MTSVIQAPLDMVETMASLRFPPKADAYLQSLMARNTEGLLSPKEREELAGLVELSESLSLVRSQALAVLGRVPG